MKKLKELRKQQSISQDKMAKYLGVSQRSYGYYESGERQPPIETLIRIADYFGVTIDYLVEHTPSNLSENRQKLLDKIQTLSEEQIQALLSIIK